jgi:hypothetical protein
MEATDRKGEISTCHMGLGIAGTGMQPVSRRLRIMGTKGHGIRYMGGANGALVEVEVLNCGDEGRASIVISRSQARLIRKFKKAKEGIAP